MVASVLVLALAGEREADLGICQKVVQDDPLSSWLQNQVIPWRSSSCQGSTELAGPQFCDD